MKPTHERRTNSDRGKIRTVRKAIFPAAGLGTRFLPATKAQPKEMLPLVDKPIIQYGVEEAMAAGCDQITLTARGRTAQESRAAIRCAARGRWFPSRASGGRVHRDPRNGLPQAQQEAQKSGKHLPNTVFQLPWRARTQQFAQDQAQVERADMDQLPLQNVFVSAQMATPHAARLVAVRETALDQLAAPPQ